MIPFRPIPNRPVPSRSVPFRPVPYIESYIIKIEKRGFEARKLDKSNPAGRWIIL